MPTDNKRKPKVYTNKEDYLNAKQAEKDSVNLRNLFVKDYNFLQAPNTTFSDWVDYGKNDNGLREILTSMVKNPLIKRLPKSIKEHEKKLSDGFMGKKGIGILEEYAAPTTTPIYQPKVTNSVPPIVKPKPNLVKTKPKLVLEPIKPLGIKPMETSVEAKLAGNVTVPAMSNTKGVTQNYTGSKALQIQGKPSGYTNEGDRTGRQEFRKGGWLDGIPSIKPNFQTIWDTDKDILEFRRVFKERFGEEPGTEDGGVYNIQEAVMNGERPRLDKSDGLYHWSDKYKLPDHPTFSNQSKYYKPGMKAVKWVNEEPVNIETQNYTGSKALKIQGKSTGYVNIGDGTGRQEVKKFGGWLDGLEEGKTEQAPDVTNATEYIKNWYNSPMYGNILKNQFADSGVKNPKRIERIAKRYVKFSNKEVNSPFYNVTPDIVDNPEYYGKSIDDYKGGRKINLNRNFVENNPKLVNSLFAHELAHDNLMTNKDTEYVNKNTPEYNPAIHDEKIYNTLTDPGEVRSQIHSIRQLSGENKIYDPLTQPFKKEYLDKVNESYNQGTKDSENYNQLQRLRKYYSDDQITEMMNTISKSNSNNGKVYAKNGGWLNNLPNNKFDMGGVLDGLDGVDKGTQVPDATATAKPVVNLNFAITPAQKQQWAKNKRQAEIDMQVDHPEFYTNPNFLDKKAVKPYSVEDYKKGIKEPGLQTSMDPIDLVGTGVYKGVAKALGAKEVAKGYIGLIEDAVKYAEKKNAFPTVLNTAENIGYELSTTPKKISPTYQTQAKAELEKANNWSESWYNDPATKERLLKLSEESNLQRAAEINKQRAFTRNNPSNLKNYTQDELNIIFADIKPTDLSNNWDEILKNIQNKSYISTFQSKNAKLQKILKGQPRTHEGNYGLSGYMLDSDYKGVRQNLVNKYSPKIKSTGIHEGNHGLTDGNELLPISDQEDIVKIFGDNTKVPARNNKNQFNSYEEYLQDPTEVYARIMELREHFKMKPGEIIDDDTIFKIMADGEKAKTPVDASFFTLIKNPYKFKDLFNRLPVAIPTAIGVGALQQDKKQNGGWLDNLK